MAASDLIIPGARRFSVSIPWLLLILVGTMGLFFVGARLIGHRNFLLGMILKLSVILIWSILGITVTWPTGRRNVFASIVGGAAGPRRGIRRLHVCLRDSHSAEAGGRIRADCRDAVGITGRRGVRECRGFGSRAGTGYLRREDATFPQLVPIQDR